MHQELERLIDLALADGKITDKELEVLYRKAKELAVDMDEFELVLEGKLHLAHEATIATKPMNASGTTTSTSQKEGDARKCPSCGASVPSFVLACSSCGHEFRNTMAASSVQKLFDSLQAAPLEMHASIISNYPVPNTKEDILEFLSIAIGNCAPLTFEQKQTYSNAGFWSSDYRPELAHREAEIRAWQSKFTTVVQKARILLTDETATRHINDFEKRYSYVVTFEAKEDKKTNRNVIIGIAASFVLIMAFMWVGGNSHTDDTVREAKRLEAIVDQINSDIEANNLRAALVKASGLKWEYSDSWSHYEQEKKSWDEKRETMIKTIQNIQDVR